MRIDSLSLVYGRSTLPALPIGGQPSAPVIARPGRHVRLRISSMLSFVTGSTPGCSGNLFQTSSPITCAVRSACSTRCARDLGRELRRASSAPVWLSSSRSSSRRTTRSLAAITPVPSPECTPSVSSETSSVPMHEPAQRRGRPQLVVVRAAGVEAHDERQLADARREVIDVRGQVVAAALLARLDQDDAARVRELVACAPR